MTGSIILVKKNLETRVLPLRDSTIDRMVVLTGYPEIFDKKRGDPQTSFLGGTILLGTVIDSMEVRFLSPSEMFFPGDIWLGASGSPVLGLESRGGKKTPVILGIETEVQSGLILGFDRSKWYTKVQTLNMLSAQINAAKAK